jgi:chromosome segregation ATPase
VFKAEHRAKLACDELDSIREQFAALKNDHAQAVDTIKELQAELEQQRATIRQRDLELDESREQCNTLEALVKAAREEAAQAASELALLQTKFDTIAESVHTEQETLRNNVASQEHTISKLKEELQEKEEQLRENRSYAENVQAQLDSALSQCEALMLAEQQAKKDLVEQQAQIVALQDAKEACECEVSRLPLVLHMLAHIC